MLLAQLFVSQFDQLVQEATRQNLRDLHLARPQRVQEEKELPHSCAHVERVERPLEHLQLRQRRNQLENVILQVGLLEVAQAGAIIQRQAYSGLMQPELFRDVAKELVDRHASVCVALEQLGEYDGGEEGPAFGADHRADLLEVAVVDHDVVSGEGSCDVLFEEGAVVAGEWREKARDYAVGLWNGLVSFWIQLEEF